MRRAMWAFAARAADLRQVALAVVRRAADLWCPATVFAAAPRASVAAILRAGRWRRARWPASKQAHCPAEPNDRRSGEKAAARCNATSVLLPALRLSCTLERIESNSVFAVCLISYRFGAKV